MEMTFIMITIKMKIRKKYQVEMMIATMEVKTDV